VPGFTLIELLVVIVILGILATLSVAGWVSFVENYALSSAEDRLYRNLREAQSNAKRDKLTWQVSLRTDSAKRIEIAIHQANTTPPAGLWQPFDDRVRLLEADTTFRKDSSNNVYYLQFNSTGHVNGQLGRATFTTAGNLAANSASIRKRCVFTSTLIGALRKAQGSSCTR